MTPQQFSLSLPLRIVHPESHPESVLVDIVEANGRKVCLAHEYDAPQLVRSVNCFAELLAACKAMTQTMRTFRNVPKAEQDWGPLDDESLEAGFAAVENAEREEQKA